MEHFKTELLLFFFLFIYVSSNKLFNFNTFRNIFMKLQDVEKDENTDKKVKPRVDVRYEDKYFDKLKTMPNLFGFNDEDKLAEIKKHGELLLVVNEDIGVSKQEILSCEQELSDLDDFGPSEDKIESSKNVLNEKLTKLKIHLQDVESNTIEEAKLYAINKFTERLANCFIFEKTPLGNVIMLYNAKRETFEYYSDNSIPYRYLESACRKYVITFHCKPLYVDMGTELKEYEQKILLQEKEKEIEMEKSKEKNKTAIPDQKKSVFTKFKSYNVATGRVNTGAPAKNNIQNIKTTNQNEKTILKDNANRYSYQGKIINFSILKKVDKKLVNKKYKMTFADFKNRVVQ
jgi:hypothetical protein